MVENEMKTKEGKILCPREQLNLETTLHGGQSFRWYHQNDGYRGVFDGCVWTLTQDDTHLFYVVQGPLDDTKNYDDILSQYFRLDVSLPDLCKEWCAVDDHFPKSLNKAIGARILNQDVVENIFSFICKSNNKLPSISARVERLCSMYGEKICSIEGKGYYSFPSIEALANQATEYELRNRKFGKRSNHVVKTAKLLMKLGGKEWLLGLHKDNNVSYSKAKEELSILPGVRPKIADSVCLMSLGHLDAVPLNVGVKDRSVRKYFSEEEKPIDNEKLRNRLRELWGPYAGWAQFIVFCVKL